MTTQQAYHGSLGDQDQIPSCGELDESYDPTESSESTLNRLTTADKTYDTHWNSKTLSRPP